MKRTIAFLLAGFLVFGSGKTGIAQESIPPKPPKGEKEITEKQEKELQKKREEEFRVRKEFLEQEQQERMRRQEMALEAQAEALEELHLNMEDFHVDMEDMEWRAPVIIREGFEGDGFVWHIPQNSQTQLTLRNSFRGGTDSSTGSFDVEEGTKRFKCMINGKVRSGEIKIKISYPDGKVFKDMTINSSAEITFSQSLNIGEKEPDKYIGSWKYEIAATKAEGNYMLSISTN